MNYKKIISVILSVIVFGAMLSGCSAKNTENEQAQLQQEGKLKVYASFYPMYDFAQKIGGDKIELYNIIPTGTEPHEWEPTPKDMQNIAEADMLIYNGLGMEGWLEKVVGAAENDSLIMVEASKGIDLISEDGGKEAAHYDPHVWTSLKNAVIEMENIKNSLCEADSENAAVYEQNFAYWKGEFEKLDAEFAEMANNAQNKSIVTSHDAFSYLCRDYALEQVAIGGISAEEEPDPSKMAEIVDFIKKNDIKVIFFEELASPKVAETIAVETKAVTMVLNPVEGLTQEELENGEDYLSVMRKNLEALKSVVK